MDEMIGAQHGEFLDKLLQASFEGHSSPGERHHLADSWKMHLRQQGKLRPSKEDADQGCAEDDDVIMMFALKSPESRDRAGLQPRLRRSLGHDAA